MRRWLIGFAWFIPLLLWFDCAIRPISEPDLFFYFALVEKYLSTGCWPVKDPFLYTLPNDTLMTLHQWLGYWFYYIPFVLFGWAGPILLMALTTLILLFIPLAPWWAKRRPLPFYFPLLWTIAIFVAHHRFRERVSLFGDLLTVGLVAGLFWLKDQRRFWIALPFGFLLWAQLHPSYPLGWFILIAFFVVDRSVWNRTAILSLFFCLLVPLLNPLGGAGVLYPFKFALHIEPLLSQYVMEWLPLTDSRLFAFRFLYLGFVTVIPFLLWRMWRGRRRSSLFDCFILLLAIALYAKSVRFGLMAQGLFLLLFSEIELRNEPDRPSTWGPVLAALLSLVVAGFNLISSETLWQPPQQRFGIDLTYFPEHATDELEKLHPRMHIFNSFGYGGYLAWRWGGNPPLFFHGFSTNFDFFVDNYNRPQESQQSLQALIQRFDLGIFLISKMGNDAGFIMGLLQNPEWQKIYEDEAAVIFAKRDPRAFAP